MPRMIALNMTRPHERLGMRSSRAWRLSRKMTMLNAAVLGVTLCMTFGYIIQVNKSSAQGFMLRDAEKQKEKVHTEVLILEDKAARLSSVESLGTRADALGLVPVGYVEYVHPASKSYALK